MDAKRRVSSVFNCPLCGLLQPGWLLAWQLVEHVKQKHPEMMRQEPQNLAVRAKVVSHV